MFKFIIVLIVNYLIGGIPTGYLFVKGIKNEDIRTQGSGNVGGTNAIRILGFKRGIWVIILDMAKGAAAVLLAMVFLKKESYLLFLIASYIAVIGHTFTPFLRFKGGKGVATSAGIYFVLAPMASLFAVLSFGLVFGLLKVVSMATIVAVVVLDAVLIVKKADISLIIITLLVSALIIYLHKANIKRIVKGKELGFKKKSK